MESISLVICRFHSYRKLLTNLSPLKFYRNKHQLAAATDEVRHPGKLSTLFVPGRYGANMYQIVKPVININEIVQNINTIQHSFRSRGIDVDIENSIDLLRQFETERDSYLKFVEKDHEYLTELKNLKSLNDESKYNNLRREHDTFLIELKAAKEKFQHIEEMFLSIIAKLPNIIHPCTPLQSDTIEEYVTPKEINLTLWSHVEIGKKMSFFKHSKNSSVSYYLTGILSDLELAIQTYFYNKFIENGRTPMACVDFCKSFLLEAVGLDPFSPDQCISLKLKAEQGQKLHLGRCYNAKHRHQKSFDLFSVVQSSNFHCLTLCEDSKNEDEEFESLFNLLISCYSDFKIPFRAVNCGAKNLNTTESRRKLLEVWSPAEQMYKPVAYVSQRGDFVSKRLHVTYGVEHVIEGYCHMVEGVAVNIPVLMGCIIENFQKSNGIFELPDELSFLHNLINE
ncbi:serine--tRNA synthetase-like protein Slimp [Trichonephila inaurata madagascariensis]|uniref:Serine--tRNA synthetase-like protein Slimp n=1 Tax=Trichonephila inaurata madagascariensis TaxID=2747483 RepID=A0A8X7C247_9ARAC|nr:serine--tRNA synthetase-like protein Slimp [Trichonephila inaurata madagascariensis]